MNSDAAAAGAGRKQAIARRSVLRGLGAGALATGAGGVLAACSSGSKAAPAASSTSTITLGYISPFTGALAGFASGDKFVIDTIRNTPVYAKGFKIGGKTYQVNIIVTDSRSDPNRASQLARQLILRNNVDLLLTSSTPETVNPVAVVGHQAFGEVSDPHDKQELANALHNVHYDGMCGLLNFAAGPAPGVAIIPPVGVQWKATGGGRFPFEMRVVDNTLNPAARLGAHLEPTNP